MSHNGNDRIGPNQGNIPGQGAASSRNVSKSPVARRQAAPSTSYAPAQGASAYSRENAHMRYANGKGKKGTTRRKVLIGAGIAAGVVVVGGVAAAATFVGSIGNRLNAGVDDNTRAVLQDQQVAAQELVSNWTDTSPFYMLLLGVDSNEERLEDTDEYGSDQSNYRSDTIILTRIDPGNKIVTLVSIHRDTYCPEINGKINSYYAMGGASAVIEKISDFAGVPISHYAEVNIDALVAVTDALGGVEVDVPYEINDTEYMGHINGGHLDAGLQVLDGAKAELFTRSRHAYDNLGDGDRYRAANQRLFIDACLKKLMSSSPVDMVNVINAVVDYVTTDLTLDQIVNLALAMRGIDTSTGVYSTMNPTTSEYVNGTWYEYNDDERWQQIMAAVDAGEKPPVDSDYVSVTDDINSASHGDSATTDATSTDSTTRNPAFTGVAVSVRGCGCTTEAIDTVVATLNEAGLSAWNAGSADLTLANTQVIYEYDSMASVASQIATLLGATATDAGEDWILTEGADVMVVVGTSASASSATGA